jgi:hypothetical protein
MENIKIIKKIEVYLSSQPYTIDDNYLPDKELIMFKYKNGYYVTSYNIGYKFSDNIKSIIEKSVYFLKENEAIDYFNYLQNLFVSIDGNTMEHINSKYDWNGIR